LIFIRKITNTCFNFNILGVSFSFDLGQFHVDVLSCVGPMEEEEFESCLQLQEQLGREGAEHVEGRAASTTAQQQQQQSSLAVLLGLN
jgi:hypothetical protein